jgi:hypothetical protein
VMYFFTLFQCPKSILVSAQHVPRGAYSSPSKITMSNRVATPQRFRPLDIVNIVSTCKTMKKNINP